MFHANTVARAKVIPVEQKPSFDTLCAVQQAFEALRREDGVDKLDVLHDLLARLNYRVVPEEPPAIPRDQWSQAMADAIPEGSAGPVIIAAGGGRALRFDFGEPTDPTEGFAVIYCALRSGVTVPLRLADERIVAQQILRDERRPHCLLVFSDPEQRHWHFVSPRRLTRARAEAKNRAQRHVLRRIAVGPGDRLRTAIDRFARIRLEPAEADTLPAAEIHRRHDIAFSVEQVTQDFFDEFKRRYFELEDCLVGQVDDRPWAHDFALRLLSRLMFIYFIQRKQWIADDPQFMAHYWQRYLQATDGGDDSFYERWLRPLFFQAFQGPGTAAAVLRLDYMPEDLRRALRNAPYLNGGLFAERDRDLEHRGEFAIPDSYFDSLLHASEDLSARAGFLEAYNFTISEDSPLDQEVAVDPEMIGRVYESLVNISEPGSDTAGDREKQRAAGIFYTPRTEIDLMCRLALSDYLCNHLGEEHRDLVYQLTFSLEPDEKREADDAIAREDLWPRIAELLEAVTVVDPACGSGSFLVGMMNILADLRLRADEFVGKNPTHYELNRDIISTSLYGVDVMEWACRVAELRLWLQLMIHADPQPDELQDPRPLLPNLSFKIRQGDSLVQELGGVNLAHLKADADIDSATKSKLRKLRDDKLSFYDAEHQEPEREQALHQRELNLFLRICQEKRAKLAERIAKIDAQLAATTPTLVGDEQSVRGRKRQRLEAAREDLVAQAERLEQARIAIGTQQQVPFVWDLAFVEILEGDRKGFDIVVGNPPYVRQEKIADPQGPPNQSREERGRYKAKLQRSVYAALPRYFGRSGTQIGARSDLYVYFYFHALSLLNDRGVFCFVTSNSWLDVDYGKVLQEFLARQVPMHLIIDNQVKRSFAQADVNTVIVLFGAPCDRRDACLDHTVRFVMALAPFEEMLDPVIMQEIEAAQERTERHEFRVFPRTQRELLEAGMHAQEGARGGKPLIKVGRYEGDKWGGKYLRAPEIYWEILERAGDRLVPLGEIADVRFGIKTGANEFFYLPSPYFDIERDGDLYRLIPKREGLPDDMAIEAEYLVPVIKSPRECQGVHIDVEALSMRLLMCHEDRQAVRSRAVGEYVQWGEERLFNQVPTCSVRPRWYDLGKRAMPPIISPSSISELARTFGNPGVYADKRMYEIHPHQVSKAAVLIATNSTLATLFLDIGSRTGLGQGLLDLTVYELSQCPVAVPGVTPELQATLQEASQRRILPIDQELEHPNRRAIDRLVFRALGLPDVWLARLYDAVRVLVHARFGRASSL